MKCLIMLIGLPCAGKTTLSKKIAELYDCDFFSSEIIGAQIDGYQSVKEDRDFSASKQEEIYEKLSRDVFASLQTRKVVVEGVFRSKHQRQKIDTIYERMKENCCALEYIKFWITCDTKIAIERVKRRKNQGTISPAGSNTLLEVSKQYDFPADNEGFIIIDNSANLDDAINRISTYIDARIRSGRK